MKTSIGLMNIECNGKEINVIANNDGTVDYAYIDEDGELQITSTQLIKTD